LPIVSGPTGGREPANRTAWFSLEISRTAQNDVANLGKLTEKALVPKPG
jgi:hypothetical protein